MADLNINTNDITQPFEDLGSNVLPNGDFEYAPAVITAATNAANRWIDGTAAGGAGTSGFGWATVTLSNAEASFDSGNAHSGTYAMRLSTLTTGSTGGTIGTHRPITAALPYVFPIYPSTLYTLTGWIKTNNVATNSAFIDFRQFNSSIGTLVTTSSTKFTGTNAYTQVSFNVTTNASAAYGTVFLRNNIAGNVGDAWFDDIILTYNPPGGNTSVTVGPIVTQGIQDINGPKIWG